MFHPFNLHQGTYEKARVSYFKLLCKIPEAHQNRTGTLFLFYCRVERATFILFVSLVRADRYVLHFSLGLPFLPRTTRVDVPVFFLPLAPSFCSSFLLPTDYAPVVDAYRHRLPRFASSHLPPFAISFPFPHSGSKYTLSLLQQSSISVSLPSAEVSSFLESSLFFHAIQLDPIRALSFSVPHLTVLRLVPFFQNPSSLRLYGVPKLLL